MFKDSVKCVPRKLKIKFQEFSRMFFQFCCCMDLIAATRAEGGLVLVVFIFGDMVIFGAVSIVWGFSFLGLSLNIGLPLFLSKIVQTRPNGVK